MKLFYVIYSCLVIVNVARCFNLDVRPPSQIFTGKPSSYFGYSLTVQNINGQARLIIGAPREIVYGKNDSGSIYQCQIGTICSTNNIIRGIAETENQWFGATLASAADNIIACAPRFGDYAKGRCYHRIRDQVFRSLPDQVPEFCNFGLTAAFSTNGDRYFIGGPSCNNIAGSLFATERVGNQFISMQPKSYEKYYFTYALASGKQLIGTEGLVASIGFHMNTIGKAVLFDPKTLNRRVVFEGDQTGELFGGSLVVSDVTGDGKDDIFIGAPLRTEYNDADFKFEIGAVYVYIQSEKNDFSIEPYKLKGEVAASRFGFAIAALGDVDQDGFNDIVVGAPYENKAGAIYIYQGSSSGLRKKHSQKILGSDFRPALSSFGFSFTTADLDGNLYPDLVVGAYQSDTAVYLPARPVVNIVKRLDFFPKQIALDTKICSLASGINVACAQLTYCVQFSGINVPRTIQVTIAIALDVDQPKQGRHYFLESGSIEAAKKKITRNIAQGGTECWNATTYVLPEIRNKLAPMKAVMGIELMESNAPLSPILNYYTDRETSNSLSILKNCGGDGICNPDLQMTASMNIDKYVQGSNERLIVNVTISNEGEDAYESQFFLYLPPSLSFINTDRDSGDTSITCSPPGEDSPILRCDIGNPLPSQKKASLRVLLQPIPDVLKNNRTISFNLETNSSTPEETWQMKDNSLTLELPVTVSTSLIVSGWTRPDLLSVNVTDLQAEEKNEALATKVHFFQTFEIRNKGPSDILGSEITIRFPLQTIQGFKITELVVQPEVKEGPATCNSIPIRMKNITDQSNENHVQGDVQDKKVVFEESDDVEIVVNCTTRTLKRNEFASIKLSARLKPDAFLKDEKQNSFTITSTAIVKVTSLPFEMESQINLREIKTIELKVNRLVAETIFQATPWWVPVVSAFGAVIVLAALVALLRKCGFFKRNLPPMQEGDKGPEEGQENQEGQQAEEANQEQETD